MQVEWRNPTFTADGRIDCEVKHPIYGWIPFTVDPNDTGASLDAAALDAEIREAGGIAPYVPPAITAEQVKYEAQRRMELFVSGYTEAERETWPTQVAEAQALANDPSAQPPLLSALAAADGVSVETFAGYVMANRAAFTAASGAILAAQRVLIAQDPIPQDYRDDKHWP